ENAWPARTRVAMEDVRRSQTHLRPGLDDEATALAQGALDVLRRACGGLHGQAKLGHAQQGLAPERFIPNQRLVRVICQRGPRGREQETLIETGAGKAGQVLA